MVRELNRPHPKPRSGSGWVAAQCPADTFRRHVSDAPSSHPGSGKE